MSEEKDKQYNHVGIIGMAGRTPEEQTYCCPLLWKRMLAHAKFVITKVWKLPVASIVLVSGGSAIADHVAVALFLQQELDHKQDDQWPRFAGLQLYLPAPIQVTGQFDTTYATGRRLNQLHAYFSKFRKVDSFKELAQIREHTKVIPFDDFMSRNRAVAAQCSHLLAFPSQPSIDTMTRGGTSYTWRETKAGCDKLYTPVSWLLRDATKHAYVRTIRPTAPAPNTVPQTEHKDQRPSSVKPEPMSAQPKLTNKRKAVEQTVASNQTLLPFTRKPRIKE